MLAVEMLPAGNGDALVIEYGEEDDILMVLVDGGTVNAWTTVRGRLQKLATRTFETLVVTHIDEDHIGGGAETSQRPGSPPPRRQHLVQRIHPLRPWWQRARTHRRRIPYPTHRQRRTQLELEVPQ